MVASGLDVGDAVRHRTPQMATTIFGWNEAPLAPDFPDRWAEAERLTNVGSARDYHVLDAAESFGGEQLRHHLVDVEGAHEELAALLELLLSTL